MHVPQRNTAKPRRQRAKKLLLNALIELLQIKPLRQITVKDLTSTAQIARNTFYHNYTSKEAFIDRICDEILTEYKRQTEQCLVGALRERVQSHNRVFFAHVAAYAAFYRAMLSERDSAAFRNKMLRIGLEILRKLYPPQAAAPYDRTLLVQSIAFLQCNSVLFWLQNDQAYSIDHMVHFQTDATLALIDACGSPPSARAD